ncbi:MAG: hypothetical protein Q8R83_06195 [Legionellaceae bacterium]|nr:hypothetical protein [Legionellaceae bacterium]
MPELKYVISGDEKGINQSFKKVEQASAKTASQVESDFARARDASAKSTAGILSDIKKVEQAKGVRTSSLSDIDLAYIESRKKVAEFDKQIIETKKELEKVGSAGVDNFDKIDKSVQKSSKSTSKAGGLLKLLSGLIPGLGLATIAAFAIEPIIKYVKSLDLLGTKTKEISAKKFDAPDYKEAVLDTQTLATNIEAAKNGYISKQKVVDQYNETIGKSAGLLKSFNDVEQWQKDNVGAYLKMMEMKAEAQAFLAVATEKATEAAKRQTVGANIMDYGLAIANQLGRGQFDWDGIKSSAGLNALNDAADSKKESDKAFAIYRKRMAEAQKFAKDNKLNIFGDTKEDSNQASVNAYDSLLKKIRDLKNEYNRKSLSDDEAELQSVRDKFASIAEEVKKYNANPKNKIKVVSGELDGIRDAAIADLTFKQETAKLGKELEAQKQLYHDYEKFKSDFGETAAKERFGKEVNFLKYLEQEHGNMYAGINGASEASIKERDALIEKYRSSTVREEQQSQLALLKDFMTYTEQRNLILEQAQAKAKKLTGEAAKLAIEEGEKEVIALDQVNIKKWKSYKYLFENLQTLSRKQTEDGIARLKKDLAAFTGSAEAKTETLKAIAKLEEGLKKDNTKDILKSAEALRDIASSVGEVNNSMGQLLHTIANVVTSYARLTKASKVLADVNASGAAKQAAMLDVITQGVAGLVQVISTIANATKQRRDAEEAYYRSVIEGQREYNLSLNDEIRLRAELEESVFLKDSKGRILSGTNALVDANKKYLQSLQDLAKGEAKVGQRNAVDWNSVGKAAGGGAAVGAAIGSIVPVIGTAIGAAVGAVAGAIAGLFGGKKKKDVFSGLLQEYPELITKAKDGTIGINKELAKSLINQNLVNEATKDLINNTLEWADKVKAAEEQIKSVIADLAGGLGNDLRNSLVQAFKDGSDAAKAFGDDVSKVVEDIVSQFLFNELFSKNFEQLQKEMQASYGLGGDQSLVDDLSRFYSDAGPKIEEFQAALEAARTEAEKMGFDIFKKTTTQGGSQDSTGNTMAGAVTKIRADQADLIGARLGGIQVSGLESLAQLKLQTGFNAQCVDLAMQNLNVALKIEQNTFRTANNTEALKDIRTGIQSMDKKISASVNAGVGLNGFGG